MRRMGDRVVYYNGGSGTDLGLMDEVDMAL